MKGRILLLLVIFMIPPIATNAGSDKTISWTTRDHEAVYGNTVPSFFSVISHDVNGDGIVGPGDTWDHRWHVQVSVEDEYLGWFTMEQGVMPQPPDPGTTTSMLTLEEPTAPGTSLAGVNIWMWLRTLPLEVDRTYNFDIWHYNECWGMTCVIEHLPMSLFVKPIPIRDLIVTTTGNSPIENQLTWGIIETDDVGIASLSIYRGRGVEIGAQNIADGDLVAEGLSPETKVYLDTPPQSFFPFIYTIFGHDSSGKIVARSDQIAPTGAPRGVYASDVDWGDFDGDCDLDVLLTGFHDTDDFVGSIYRNENGTFIATEDSLPGAYISVVAWNDPDGDGDLDFLLAGMTDFPGRRAYLFRNDSGSFVDAVAGLPGMLNCAGGWADYDGDGDPDLVLAGLSSQRITRLYRNEGNNQFTEIDAGLPGVIRGEVTWVDYDIDGDPDLLLVGNDANDDPLTMLFQNTDASFIPVETILPDLGYCDAAWGDFDADGDPDLALAGLTVDGSSLSCIYRNDAGVLVDHMAELPGVWHPAISWGDMDNDGDLDLILTGFAADSSFGAVFRNDDGTFTEDPSWDLPQVHQGAVAWGDADNDGDLDALITGETDNRGRISLFVLNPSSVANTPPTAPSGLHAVASEGGMVTFSWNPSVDAETPSSGLTYNIRVGTPLEKDAICPGLSNPATGQRLVAQPGNVGPRTSITLHMEPGLYVWSVQAVDGAFVGSEYAPELSLDTVSGVPEIQETALPVFLHPAFPNPFNPRTEIQFDLAEPGRATLEIFDPAGRKVRSLLENQPCPAGRTRIVWDGRDSAQRPVAAGAYFLHLTTVVGTKTEKVVLIK